MDRMLKFGGLVCLIALLLVKELKGQELEVPEEKFLVKLVKIIVETQSHNRGITSPLAVKFLAALLADGANYQTEAEIRKAVILPDREKCRSIGKSLEPLLKETNGKFRLVMSDKIYIDEKFKVKKEFIKIAKSNYYTEVQNVNFADTAETRQLINDWITQKSLNKVHNIIHANQINRNTKMVLVSNIWMKGLWEIPFPPSETAKKTFHFASKVQKKITMMNSVGSYRFKHCGYLKAKFLEIPFKNSSVSTTFILPDAQDGIEDVVNNLELYLKPHDFTRQKVAVTLPKFPVNTEHDYKELLEGLGVKKLFNAREADLPGISDQKGLSVDVFQQKIFINITESGIGTGAIKTGDVKPFKPEEPPKQTFNADHPFFFYIKDAKSGVFILTGNFLK